MKITGTLPIALGLTLPALVGAWARAGDTSWGCSRYPGPSPGPVTERYEGREIGLGTRAIAVTWTWTPDGLRTKSIRDGQAGVTVEPGGEVFQIVLGDGTTYAASALSPEDPPRVSLLEPDRKSSREAALQGARKLELKLRSGDGRLRVVWRARMRPG